MEVAVFDPYAADWVEGVQRVAGLDELLCRSDVFSLHVPLKEETTGVIGGTELALLSAGSVLINTSGGALVDEAAFAQALERQYLAGAALDVISHGREPEQRQLNPLLAYARTHDNLIITPHIAGATHEFMAKTELFMAHKLAAYLQNIETSNLSANTSSSNQVS